MFRERTLLLREGWGFGSLHVWSLPSPEGNEGCGGVKTGLTGPVRNGIQFTRDSDSAPECLEASWLPEVELSHMLGQREGITLL